MLDSSILSCFERLYGCPLRRHLNLRFAVPYESSWMHSDCTRSRLCHSVDLLLKVAYQKVPSMAIRHFRVCNATACMGGICLHIDSEHCKTHGWFLPSSSVHAGMAQPLNSITVHLVSTRTSSVSMALMAGLHMGCTLTTMLTTGSTTRTSSWSADLQAHSTT